MALPIKMKSFNKVKERIKMFSPFKDYYQYSCCCCCKYEPVEEKLRIEDPNLTFQKPHIEVDYLIVRKNLIVTINFISFLIVEVVDEIKFNSSICRQFKDIPYKKKLVERRIKPIFDVPDKLKMEGKINLEISSLKLNSDNFGSSIGRNIKRDYILIMEIDYPFFCACKVDNSIYCILNAAHVIHDMEKDEAGLKQKIMQAIPNQTKHQVPICNNIILSQDLHPEQKVEAKETDRNLIDVITVNKI